MSGGAWARRLAVMSPGEIAHRLRIALRDRLAPPAWARWSPAEAGARLFADVARTPASAACYATGSTCAERTTRTRPRAPPRAR